MYEKSQRDLDANASRARRLAASRVLGSKGLMLTILFWWLVLLSLLFLVLAWRPPAIYEQGLESGRGLPDYFARVAGLVPQECALTEANSTPPDSGETNRPLAVAGVDRLFAFPRASEEGPCEWRLRWGGLAAALSPEIGPVQKITFLCLVAGIVLLYRQARQLAIDDLVFPTRGEPGDLADVPDDVRRQRLEHPVTLHLRRSPTIPLYPRETVVLTPLSEGGSATGAYKNNLDLLKERLIGRVPLHPIDLIIGIVQTGAASGDAGEAESRMREAVLDYRDRLQDRLWSVDYLLWLLPTIGFVGTIYGISVSLVRAKSIFVQSETDPDFGAGIDGVVDGLGQAFDTTALALVCAALLFYVLRRTEMRTVATVDRARKTLSELLIPMLLDRSPPSPSAPLSSAPPPRADEPAE